MPKPVFYEFAGSVWAFAPKIAITECGFKPGDIEVKPINLPAGENFYPDGYLKINPRGTVPALVDGGETFIDSTTVVEHIIKIGPDSPKTDSKHRAELEKLIHATHSEKHDPNTMFLLPRDDADLEAKAKGIPGGFVGGRQKALDAILPTAPEEFKSFLEAKSQGNGAIVKLFTDSDAAYRAKFYQIANDQWKDAGEFIRGEVTHILKKTPGSFLGGADRPGEADFHLITWLARTVSNAGVPPGGKVSSIAIATVQEKTGGEPFDPVIAGYWDSWIIRDSFKSNGVN